MSRQISLVEAAIVYQRIYTQEDPRINELWQVNKKNFLDRLTNAIESIMDSKSTVTITLSSVI